MDTISIIFVAPYRKLEGEVRNAFRKLDRPDIRYKILFLTPDEEQLISKLNSDVIISRGYTAAFFRTFKIPTVELSTTGYDLILAVYKGINSFGCRHLAVIGAEPMLFDTIQFSAIFPGVQVDCYRSDTRSHVAKCMQDAMCNGATVLIGGRFLCEMASEKNIPCVMVENGRESIIKSIEIAIQLVEATRTERTEADRIAKIMDYSFDGILSIDTNGIISDINQKACVIFGGKRTEILGHHISEYVPSLNTDAVIKHGERLLEEVCHINSNLVSLNCVPIEGKQTSSGAVITCQEAREVHKTEARIRKKILRKGFVARYCFSDIIGQDAEMRSVKDQAVRFSNSCANILLYGETGVGKEMFAQSIHNASSRRSAPFVAINCAALPEQLLESELFGYVEGAFTGAAKSGKVGLFEAAHCGTIFLDEIGDLSLKLQGRLLRVLQEKEIIRLGDDHVIPIDVRVISATNKKLSQEVAQGNFRSDLMYRLDVLNLVIPPLRERKSDILPLLKVFLQEYRHQDGLPYFERIAPDAITLLEGYPWLGNVRQLRNVAQRLSILCDGDEITPTAVRRALDLRPDLSENTIIPDEVNRIRDALKQTHFRRGDAAKLLGIDRSTLYRKMKKYDLTKR